MIGVGDGEKFGDVFDDVEQDDVEQIDYVMQILE